MIDVPGCSVLNVVGLMLMLMLLLLCRQHTVLVNRGWVPPNRFVKTSSGLGCFFNYLILLAFKNSLWRC